MKKSKAKPSKPKPRKANNEPTERAMLDGTLAMYYYMAELEKRIAKLERKK